MECRSGLESGWGEGVEGEYWILNIVLENLRNIEY